MTKAFTGLSGMILSCIKMMLLNMLTLLARAFLQKCSARQITFNFDFQEQINFIRSRLTGKSYQVVQTISYYAI